MHQVSFFLSFSRQTLIHPLYPIQYLKPILSHICFQLGSFKVYQTRGSTHNQRHHSSRKCHDSKTWRMGVHDSSLNSTIPNSISDPHIVQPFEIFVKYQIPCHGMYVDQIHSIPFHARWPQPLRKPVKARVVLESRLQ